MIFFPLLTLIRPSSAQMLGQTLSRSERLHALLSVSHAAERHGRVEDEVKVTSSVRTSCITLGSGVSVL